MSALADLAEDPVQELRAALRGAVLAPEDADYDVARRIWNGMIDRRPSVIARCAGVSDVVRAIAFAREYELPIAVRGGGHGVAGRAMCDDGLVIDLSPMKGIRVDAGARTVRAEAGVLWKELDRETQLFGLGTTGGVISTTGIAGLTLGGGFGWLMRSRGAVVDNLLSVDVVTADGRCLTAGEDENADLFWGIRGAGPNFGVVTSFEYQLHPVGPILLGGMLLHSLDRAPEGLRLYRDFTRQAPDELTTYAALVTSPDGMPMFGHVAVHAGAVEDAEQALKPLRAFGPPVMDAMAAAPYTVHQGMLDAAYPPGRLGYEKSTFLSEIEDGAIDALIGHFERVPSPYSTIVIEQHGGAIRRVPEEAMAFRHRSPEYNVVVTCGWEDPAEIDANIGWARDVVASLEPFSTGAYYVNYQSEIGDRDPRAAFGANHARLAELKAKYDPANVFRLNHNIPPAG